MARALDVIAGLQAVHRHGIVHRDVKPSNCFLDHEGRVKVGDFGLARLLEADARLTRTGSFLGTPLFASPEQLKGQAVDPRGDVYAAAATLYFLLTGRAPHEGGDSAAVAARIASGPGAAAALAPPRAAGGPGTGRPSRAGTTARAPLPRPGGVPPGMLPFGPAGELSIGGMGRHLLAVLIDGLVVIVAALVLQRLAEAWLGRSLGQRTAQTFFGQNEFLLDGLLTGLFALYFGLLEGVWGGSVGKRLLRLRVYRSSRDVSAGLWRVFLRTVLFCLLLRLPEALFLLPLDCGTRFALAMVLWTQFPRAFLVICTMHGTTATAACTNSYPGRGPCSCRGRERGGARTRGSRRPASRAPRRS